MIGDWKIVATAQFAVAAKHGSDMLSARFNKTATL
jgi:hypothetical protein